LAFLALVGVDGEDFFDVADGTVRTFGFASAAAVAQGSNNFVGHDSLLKQDGIFASIDMVLAAGDEYSIAKRSAQGMQRI
jgi:hypothetical protein